MTPVSGVADSGAAPDPGVVVSGGVPLVGTAATGVAPIACVVTSGVVPDPEVAASDKDSAPVRYLKWHHVFAPGMKIDDSTR